jgi:hypothetical protein
VEFTSAMASQLHLLSHDDDRGDGFAAGLIQLGTDLTRLVPSLLAVSLTLPRLGYDVAVTALAPRAELSPVAASLAVPLVAGESGEALLLQAADVGAFLLLADDLANLIGPGCPPIEVDRHLDLVPTAPATSIEFVLSELRVVNQAIGMLLDRGFTPETAITDLDRRAAATGLTIGAVSRRMLTELPPTLEVGAPESQDGRR